MAGGASGPASTACSTARTSTATATRSPPSDWGRDGRGDFAGCAFGDPDHSWDGGRVHIVDHDAGGEPGEPDGWLKPGSHNDEFALSFYQPHDIPVTAALARRFTTFDRYFASQLAVTMPNREYMHAAQSGGLRDNASPQQHLQEHPDWVDGLLVPDDLGSRSSRRA